MTDETHEERIARMRRLAAQGKVEPASQTGVEAYEAEVDLILNAIGHPEALVTDLSMFGDFGERGEPAIEAVFQRLGLEVDKRTLIVEAAARLRARL